MPHPSKHRLWRKNVSPTKLLHEWSRMLHKWWKRDVYDKVRFKKEQHG